MNPKDFFGELKRRNVYKIAVAYAVAAWLLIQIATQVFPFFEVPNWAIRLVVVLLVLGFPATLIFSWLFEITPEGIKRESEIDPKDSIARRTGRKIVGVTVVLAVAGAGMLAFELLRPKAVVKHKATMTKAPLSIPEKSIAVLPFENLSDDKENAYFADGVQDEILTDLARVADLKVISRTSVLPYRSKAARNLRAIGQELGVAHLLEGSVQRSGKKVRVNAQLIDARTDAHLWAHTYDRDLKDVFAIQSEIAETIAQQLQARLSPDEHRAIQQPPTTDLTAYDLYRRARALDDLVNVSNSKDRLLEAIRLLQEAVQRDPKYYLAYCLMVEVHTDLYWGGFDPTPARLELAKAALEKAESIQPDAGEVHFAKGTYLYHGFRDYEGARAECELARKALPNFARVHVILGAIARRQARWDDAVLDFQRAMQIDPRDGFIFEEAGLTYGGLRRANEAKGCMERAFALNPDDAFAGAMLGMIPFIERADIHALRERLDALQRAGKANAIPMSLIDCALAERNRAAAEQALQFVPAAGTVDSIGDISWPRDWLVGLVARTFGQTEKARAAFLSARGPALATTQQLPDYPAGWILLGMIDAGSGRKSEAIAEGRRACELLPLSKDHWDGANYITNLALIYAWVGEKGLALDQLALSARIPAGVTYGDLKLSPKWDPLRGEPRFDQIVASLAPK